MSKEQLNHEPPQWRQVLDRYESARFVAETIPNEVNYKALKEAKDELTVQVFISGLFDLGRVVGSPAALDLLEQNNRFMGEYLVRHKNGDFGNIPEEDVKENNYSIEHGHRILSSYEVEEGVSVWILTEADRSSTCLLLPADY